MSPVAARWAGASSDRGGPAHAGRPMTPMPFRHIEQAVLATMKPLPTLRHLAGCPAVMASVRRWAGARLQMRRA